MKFKKFKHENVLPDGRFADQPGAVGTKGSVRMSEPSGGCTLDGCTCSEGHWLMICQPRTPDGVVEGITVYFDDQSEMDLFLEQRVLSE